MVKEKVAGVRQDALCTLYPSLSGSGTRAISNNMAESFSDVKCRYVYQQHEHAYGLLLDGKRPPFIILMFIQHSLIKNSSLKKQIVGESPADLKLKDCCAIGNTLCQSFCSSMTLRRNATGALGSNFACFRYKDVLTRGIPIILSLKTVACNHSFNQL